MKQTIAAPASEQIRVSLSIRAYYDLVALATLALLLPLLVLLPLPLLRVPLGLALVLLAPGYTFSAAIFARRDDLDGVTRLALSFGLSIAVLPLLALALDLSPWGIRLWPMSFALAGWIGLWSGLAAIRRSRLARAHCAMVPPPIALRSWWDALNRRQRLSYAGSTLIGTALLLWVIVGLPALTASAPTTEFYVLGAQGLAQDYPRVATVGTATELRVGIHNREGAPVTYRIVARAGAIELARLDGIQVAAAAIWEQPLRYTIAQTGDDQQLDILLFRGNETTPYRQLHLWIDVQEPLP